MDGRRPAGAVLAGLTVAFALGAGGVRSPAVPYADGPPPGHTGGFGESTCQRCHFDAPLDEASEALRLDGLPGVFEPGRRYRLRLSLAGESRRAGFQMTARFGGGDRHGGQAGGLHPIDDRTQVRDSAGVEYLAHTRAGSAPGPSDSLAWSLEWVAPRAAEGSVILHIAANAANDDASEFGDEIHLLEVELAPAR